MIFKLNVTANVSLLTSLTGQAAEWAMAILHSDSDTAHSYLEFTHQLRLPFDHLDSEVETDTRLYHLKQQVQSVSKFTSKFRTLAVQTSWGDPALRKAFFEGLAPRIKDKLMGRELPATLEGLIQLCLRIDPRMGSCLQTINGIYQPATLQEHITHLLQFYNSGCGPLSSRGTHAVQTHLPDCIDHDFACLEALSQPVHITAIDGPPLNISPITHRSVTLTVLDHTKSIYFLVTSVSSPSIILSHPRLTLHNPLVFWGLMYKTCICTK